MLRSKREERDAIAASTAFQQQQILFQQQNTDQNLANPAKANQLTGTTLTNNNNPMANANQLAIVNLLPGATATNQEAAINANLNSDQGSLDPIEMLIKMNANNSLDEYYPALAIHLMMKTIKNSVSLSLKYFFIQE